MGAAPMGRSAAVLTAVRRAAAVDGLKGTMVGRGSGRAAAALLLLPPLLGAALLPLSSPWAWWWLPASPSQQSPTCPVRMRSARPEETSRRQASSACTRISWLPGERRGLPLPPLLPLVWWARGLPGGLLLVSTLLL